MQTPTHVIINLALLGRLSGWKYPWALILGGIIPDALMVVFYAAQRFWHGRSDAYIWDTAYFDPAWQSVFDVSNSFVVFAAIGLIAWLYKRVWLGWLTLGMAAHALVDLFVHANDGHRHFYPLSDFRFESPISYWDSAYFGDVFRIFELILLFTLGAYAIKKWESRTVSWVVWFSFGFVLAIRLFFYFTHTV